MTFFDPLLYFLSGLGVVVVAFWVLSLALRVQRIIRERRWTRKRGRALAHPSPPASDRRTFMEEGSIESSESSESSSARSFGCCCGDPSCLLYQRR
jgi:hypothetical protein